MNVLPPGFYDRDVLVVAQDLLGTILVHCVDGQRRAGRIVETEAYAGPHDLASHSSRGRTKRTMVMFGPAGVAYVYLIYGMHNCLNAVTAAPGAAVLIRAIEPLEGVLERTDGPGRLCRALGIDRRLDGAPLTGPELWIEPRPPGHPSFDISNGPRVGVDYAGEWAAKPWRYWVSGNRYVSRVPRPAR
jgi:DNA-3-methyladenine glycosylase